MIIGIDANEANLATHQVGINQYAFDLLHALYCLNTTHIFVIYLKSAPRIGLPLSRPGWTYRVITFPKLWTQTRLPVDLIVHKPRPDVFLSLTHYAPRWCPVPSVVTIMDVGFLSTPDQFTSKDFNQLKSWTKYSISNAKKVIAISDYTKKDIIKNYSKPSKDIVVTPLSYDEQLFKPTQKPSVLKKYNITQPYILFLSSLKPSKNIEGLIEAYDTMKIDDVSLVIAGKKGWLYEKIFALVNAKKLNKKIIFTGFVDEVDVPVLMSMAKAFVLPSFFEGFGIPVLEAMACGTPVVVSNIASLPEVAGDAGIYIDPNNIQSIVNGIKVAMGPKRNEFVRKGLNRVKSFSWENTAKQTILCLETAMENR